MTALVILSGVLGLALGSFLNVLIVRLPAGDSVVRPGSRCPRCGAPVRWIHNVPVASWLALGGRCASCRERIGWQYPVVELATAVIWAGHSAAWGATPRALSGAVLLTLFGFWLTIPIYIAVMVLADKRPRYLYSDEEEERLMHRLERRRARQGRSTRLRSEISEIDRRVADLETHYTSSNSRLAAEIESLR